MIKGVNILFFFLTSNFLFGQYIPSFTAFMETDLLYNPSVSGNKECLSSMMGYRSQWVGVDGAPNYFIFSTSLPTKNSSIGMGLNFLNESIGANRNNLITANLSYRFLVSHGVLSFGLSGGVKNINYNNDLVEVSNSSDPVFLIGSRSYYNPYFGFGTSYKVNNLFFGIAIADISNQNFSEDLTLSFNYKYEVNKELILTSYVFYKNGLSKISQMEMGCAMDYNKKVGLYLGFRTNQDILLGLRLGLTEQIFLFYCYDFITKYYAGYTGGTHEFILKYNLIEEKQANNPRDF